MTLLCKNHWSDRAFPAIYAPIGTPSNWLIDNAADVIPMARPRFSKEIKSPMDAHICGDVADAATPDKPLKTKSHQKFGLSPQSRLKTVMMTFNRKSLVSQSAPHICQAIGGEWNSLGGNHQTMWACVYTDDDDLHNTWGGRVKEIC